MECAIPLCIVKLSRLGGNEERQVDNHALQAAVGQLVKLFQLPHIISLRFNVVF